MKKGKRLKKAVAAMLGVLCLFQIKPLETQAAEYWPEGPSVESPSAIVMEIDTGTVLYEKNSTDAHYPASITKIMTTLIALENSDLNEVVTFSDEAIDNTGGSGIARDYGEQMTMEECLYGIMLNSSNECSYAVAEHVGGTVENFVDMMNAKAKELGCTNTHFANPHGLHDENHYTCCRDMALIGQAAYQNETFRIITGTARYSIPPTNKHSEETPLQNHNEMLYPFKTNSYVYEYCTGGKTGWTSMANSTLVTFAEKDGMRLVCVVMDTQSPNQWTDSINLFDYCFDNFQVLNIAENETKYTANDGAEAGSLNVNDPFVRMDGTAVIVLPKTAEFADAQSKVTYNNEISDVAGTISYTYAGHDIGSVDIVTTGVKIQGYVFDNQEKEDAKEEVSTVQIKPWEIMAILVGIVAAVLLIIVIKRVYDNFYIIRHNMMVRKSRREQFKSRKKKNKRQRRRRR